MCPEGVNASQRYCMSNDRDSQSLAHYRQEYIYKSALGVNSQDWSSTVMSWEIVGAQAGVKKWWWRSAESD